MPFSFDITEIVSNPQLLWVVIVFLVFYIIFTTIKNLPEILKLKSLIYLPLAKFFKFIFLQKRAIKSDIQGTVNYAVKLISKELSQNSLRPVQIEFVRTTDVENFIKEGKVFVRIRPVQSQDDNFLKVLQLYLELALIPESKNLLTTPQLKAITYFTSKRIVHRRKTLTNKLHDDYYSLDQKQYPRLHDYFEKIERVDSRGLFFSVFVRTIERGASFLRFKQGSLRDEFDKILEHLLVFVSEIGKQGQSSTNKDFWIYNHTDLSFAILLVANPNKAYWVKPSSYVNRLEKDLKYSDWVFVVFSQKEYAYGQQVAHEIENSGLVDLVDSVESHKDYRKKTGGYIKIYVKKDKLKKY